MREGSRSPSRAARATFVAVMLVQIFFGLLQVNEQWTRGHNGWNSSAYHQSAKNSLRWSLLFPLQYYTGVERQPDDAVYTHHPLAMHFHNTAAMWAFGDHRAVVRGMAAAFGVLAAWMLFFVVRRLWGDWHAVLATGLYVVLPINAIFINMANHISGFIAFTLLTLLAYVRLHEERERLARGETSSPSAWRRWLVLLYVSFALSAFWDWPANYVALILASHWSVAGTRRARACIGSWRTELLAFSGFCLVVLAMFVGHLVLVYVSTGSLSELLHIASARQGTGGFSFGHHLRTVPLLMFSWPVLALVVAFAVAFLGRAIRRRLAIRDLVPFTFAVTGVTHYVVFRQSAVVHEFWAWHTLPFVAIACATSLIAAGRFIATTVGARLGGGDASSARATLLASVVLAVFMWPFALHAARVIPDGRRVGGSMWFVAPVRGPEPFPYDSGRVELRFAELVNEWTDRDTGVLVNGRLYRIVPEPRWEITLDRELRRAHVVPRVPPKVGAVAGWVYLARRDDVSEGSRMELAARHPYTEVGPFFMADLRTEGENVRAFDLVPGESSLVHSLFVSPFEPPLVAERNEERERALRDAVRTRAAPLAPASDAGRD
jgi:4-amino-4-deoxy-L-arabinose transferase-like glycosyltransferase